ncbi:hypothetical protein CRG98_019953 [Punica granatum]|uniref:Uncharacterized protein n=1 Tax=Punica granatum TaxID=22663 RepID=A0A2I0JTJ8_PUNGR|nr:hypothetical protein CRG98_019953 [Punica granatum]
MAILYNKNKAIRGHAKTPQEMKHRQDLRTIENLWVMELSVWFLDIVYLKFSHRSILRTLKDVARCSVLVGPAGGTSIYLGLLHDTHGIPTCRQLARDGRSDGGSDAGPTAPSMKVADDLVCGGGGSTLESLHPDL